MKRSIITIVIFVCFGTMYGQSPYIECADTAVQGTYRTIVQNKITPCEQARLDTLQGLKNRQDFDTFSSLWFSSQIDHKVSIPFKEELKAMVTCDIFSSDTFITSCTEFLFVHKKNMRSKDIFPILAWISTNKSLTHEVALQLLNTGSLNDCTYMTAPFLSPDSNPRLVFLDPAIYDELIQKEIIDFLLITFNKDTLHTLINDPCVVKKLNL